ncbi:hypothetical protein L1887_43461 [Cichorium endivia]|nr:hypothetical protein L1887_43461 [Cichorium endivia]
MKRSDLVATAFYTSTEAGKAASGSLGRSSRSLRRSISSQTESGGCSLRTRKVVGPSHRHWSPSCADKLAGPHPWLLLPAERLPRVLTDSQLSGQVQEWNRTTEAMTFSCCAEMY